MTRNGKIARLPRSVQEELNRRLDNHEQGKELVAWLNSLPEVNAILARDFDGKPIREQNLSEWKQGGYQDWQQQQERRELFQQLQVEAGDLTSIMGEEQFNRHFNLLLKTNLALVVRDVMEQVAEPAKRAEALASLAGKYAQLRREESNATRAQTIQERWKREQEVAESCKRATAGLMPGNALLLQRLYLDSCGQGHSRSPVPGAGDLAGNFFGTVPDSGRQTDPGESD